jgi:hypothetical protein
LPPRGGFALETEFAQKIPNLPQKSVQYRLIAEPLLANESVLVEIYPEYVPFAEPYRAAYRFRFRIVSLINGICVWRLSSNDALNFISGHPDPNRTVGGPSHAERWPALGDGEPRAAANRHGNHGSNQ